MADEEVEAPEVEAPEPRGLDGEPIGPVAPPKPAGPAPAATPAGELPPEIGRRLQQAGLKSVPGEDRETALIRLADHLHGRASTAGKERAEFKRELAAIKERLEPMYRREWAAAQAERTAQLAATIPDRETDPVGYSIWLQEQQILRGQQQDEQAAEAAEIETSNHLETQAFVELAVALGQQQGVPADAEAVAAYNAMAQAGYNAAAERFPEAEPEEILEYLRLAQQDWFRSIKATGQNVVERLKEDYRRVQQLYGAAQPAAAAPRPGTAAAKVQAARTASAARSAVTRPAAARASAAAVEIDPATMSEEEYVAARLHGQLASSTSQKRFGNREAV